MMKKFFLIITASLVSLMSLNAQDIENVRAAYNDGAQAFADKNYQLAVEKFEEALSMAEVVGPDAEEVASNCKQNIPALYLQIAKGLVNEKNFDGAQAALENAVAKGTAFGATEVVEDANSLVAQVNMAAGKAKFNEKDFAGAAALFKKVTETDAANGQAWLLLGQAAIRANDEATAFEAFAKAGENGQQAAADKELCKYYYTACANAYKAKKFTEAYNAGIKAAAYSFPEGAKALSIAGKSAYAAKKYDDAVECFVKYVAANPGAKDLNQTLYQIADSYEKLGKKSEACSYFKQIPAADANFGAYAAGKIKELGC